MPRPNLNPNQVVQLTPFQRALLLFLCQYSDAEFGVTHRELQAKFNVARATTDRAIKKLGPWIKQTPGFQRPIRFAIDYDSIVRDSHKLGLRSSDLKKREPRNIDALTDEMSNEEPLAFYETHFGRVPIEHPVEIVSESLEQLLQTLTDKTPQAMSILDALPKALNEAYEATSNNRRDKEAVMQMAWQLLENTRAVAATYLALCDIYMFDPRMKTSEYWSVFMYRIPKQHAPVITAEKESVFDKSVFDIEET